MNSKKCLVIIISVVVMSSISMFSEEKGKEVYEVELSSGVVENEEYEERVVVRGRWGVGAGEFGIMYKDDQEYKPESLAVDSKGNIYILDLVNNRIQKFSNDGRYLLSIPVDSLKGEVRYWEGKPVKNEVEGMEGTYLIEPTETRGVNIVIDSKDNLYYYCIKGDKGEVWMFKDDKLVKRWGEETGESKPLLDKEVKKFQDRWVDGIGMGFGFTVAIVVVGMIREFLGSGSLFGSTKIIDNPILIMILPPGAFLVLGCLVTFTRYIESKIKKQEVRISNLPSACESCAKKSNCVIKIDTNKEEKK